MSTDYELLGMNLQRATLMGKPHIGDCSYADNTTTHLNRNPYEVCQICGRPATNTHHIVQKGAGGGSSFLTLNGQRLRSPLIAVCGCGNMSGCHELFHDGKIKVRWDWYEKRYETLYVAGELEIEPHSKEFFRFGCYEISSPFGKRVIES